MKNRFVCQYIYIFQYLFACEVESVEAEVDWNVALACGCHSTSHATLAKAALLVRLRPVQCNWRTWDLWSHTHTHCQSQRNEERKRTTSKPTHKFLFFLLLIQLMKAFLPCCNRGKRCRQRILKVKVFIAK